MPAALDNRILIPAGVVVQIVALIISLLVFWQKIDTRITALETMASDRYTLTMAAEQALRTAIANPGLKVADPRNPGQYITVEERG